MSDTATTLPPIHVFDAIPSTNDLAMEGASEGAPHGSCWVADRQTSGRGRREVGGARRAWFSPPGAGIYASVLLRPKVDAAAAAPMTLGAALGVRRALVDAGVPGGDLWIKWPNDVYIDDLKLGGILTEGALTGADLSGVIVGLGLNVNLAKEAIPKDLEEIATSLLIATGRHWDRMNLMLALRSEILAACGEVAARGLTDEMLAELRSHDRTSGRTVEVMRDGAWTEAEARRIDDAGRLEVAFADGTIEPIQAGEVRFLQE